MPAVPGPGESGFSPTRWAAHQLFSGLRLARTVGFGVPLGNALREIFPLDSAESIWSTVREVGQGVRAAVSARSAPSTSEIPLDEIPTVSPDLFHGGEPSRVVAMADASFTNSSTGQRKTWNVIIDCPEGMTFEELEECIREHIADNLQHYDPNAIEDIVNALVNIYFLGKRF